MSGPNNIVKINLSSGPDSVAVRYGSAGVQRYSVNSGLLATAGILDISQGSRDLVKREAAETLRPAAYAVPQTRDEFVHLYARSNADIDRFLRGPAGAGGLFGARDATDAYQQRQQALQAAWVSTAIQFIHKQSREVLERFKVANPGTEKGTVLYVLAEATHEAWLKTVDGSPSFVAYDQYLHAFLKHCLEMGLVERPLKDADKNFLGWEKVGLGLHLNPEGKFKVSRSGDIENGIFRINTAGQTAYTRNILRRWLIAATTVFNTTTGDLGTPGISLNQDPFIINTVAGDWETLNNLYVPEVSDWQLRRSAYLFKLQADNVAASLQALEKESLLTAIGEGSIADRLQALIEMLRIVNLSWRIHNSWGGANDPIYGAPFALKEDGGVGIDDIHKDAATLRSTLDALHGGLIATEMDTGLRVKLPEQVAAGLKLAYKNGLKEVLDLMMDKEALETAVHINTEEYRNAPFDANPTPSLS